MESDVQLSRSIQDDARSQGDCIHLVTHLNGLFDHDFNFDLADSVY